MTRKDGRTSKVRRKPPRARPFLYVNMAMTADGKIATANRAVTTPGSKADQRNMMKLRVMADAILAGARTVDIKPVTMGPGSARWRKQRLAQGRAEYNLRVIVSRAGSVDPTAEIFKHRFSPIIIWTTKRAGERRLSRLRKVADAVEVWGKSEVNFRRALRHLHDHWGVKRVLCEGGGELNDALFRAGVVDELHLTICPSIFGGRDAPTISDAVGVDRLADAALMRLKSWKRLGDELFLVFQPAK